MVMMSMVEAIRDAIDTAMEADERVVVFGEDVGYFGPVREVYLDADNRQLICEQPSAGATRLRVGDEVQVEMPGTALHVYPQPQAA